MGKDGMTVVVISEPISELAAGSLYTIGSVVLLHSPGTGLARAACPCAVLLCEQCFLVGCATAAVPFTQQGERSGVIDTLVRALSELCLVDRFVAQPRVGRWRWRWLCLSRLLTVDRVASL